MYLKENDKRNLVTILDNLISYKTVFTKHLKYPFGEENKRCLDYVLKVCQDFGFKTCNLDNYCGYAEIGEGEKLIGIAVHLDVVPAGDGWETNPFKLTKIGNKFYGRGVSDDKGAVAASIIALKTIKDMGVLLNKRIRLIFGCNEESGCECIKHYLKECGSFDYGFTPDGDFPLINGEKGILIGNFYSKNTNIIDIYGGTSFNTVAKECTIKVEKDSFDENKFLDFIESNGLIASVIKDDVWTIKVLGKSSHSSMPQLGKNAISFALEGLKNSGFNDDFVDFFCDRFGTFTDGKLSNLKIEDEFGALTLSIGLIKKIDSKIEGSIDIRFPVTYKSSDIINKAKNYMDHSGGYFEFLEREEPLYYPLNTDFVAKLYEAFLEVAKDDELKPLVIGGGTYAKEMKNCVAYGCSFPNEDNKIHGIGEFVLEENLYKQVDYYVSAILKLLEI